MSRYYRLCTQPAADCNLDLVGAARSCGMALGCRRLRCAGAARHRRPAATAQHRCAATTRSSRTSVMGWNRSARRSASTSSRPIPPRRRSRASSARSSTSGRSRVNDKRPFGTQQDVYGIDYEWINHSLAPSAYRIARFPRRRRRRLRAAVLGQRVQHFGDELRLAVGQRDPRAERRRAARRFLPRHRRRLDLAVPPRDRRRPGVGNRLRLFRLPRPGRQLQRRALRGERARRRR